MKTAEQTAGNQERESWREENVKRYRNWTIQNLSLIGEEALISLHGSDLVNIRAEAALLDKKSSPVRQSEPKQTETESNAPNVRQVFDKAAYQREYMRKRREAGL